MVLVCTVMKDWQAPEPREVFYEARAVLLVGAALGLLVASGRSADPFAMLRAAMGGGTSQPAEAAWDYEEDDFDDFTDPPDADE